MSVPPSFGLFFPQLLFILLLLFQHKYLLLWNTLQFKMSLNIHVKRSAPKMAKYFEPVRKRRQRHNLYHDYRSWLYRGADKSLARPDWKKQLEGHHCRSDAEVIAAAETWLGGNLLNCFWVACKSWGLVTVACFLPGRAKDLSALRYYHPEHFPVLFYQIHQHLAATLSIQSKYL